MGSSAALEGNGGESEQGKVANKMLYLVKDIISFILDILKKVLMKRAACCHR